MRTFEVTHRQLRRDGRTYAIGSSIRLEDENAQVLLQLNRIKEKTADKAGAQPSRTVTRRLPRKTVVKK